MLYNIVMSPFERLKGFLKEPIQVLGTQVPERPSQFATATQVEQIRSDREKKAARLNAKYNKPNGENGPQTS